MTESVTYYNASTRLRYSAILSNETLFVVDSLREEIIGEQAGFASVSLALLSKLLIYLNCLSSRPPSN